MANSLFSALKLVFGIRKGIWPIEIRIVPKGCEQKLIPAVVDIEPCPFTLAEVHNCIQNKSHG